jgi:hypothetical protein
MYRWLMIVGICCSIGLVEAQTSTTKRRPPPKEAPVTPTEAVCRAWGDLTYALAVERDRGTSLVRVLSQMRVAFSQSGSGEDEIRLGTQLAYGVYAQAGVSPARSRQAFELGCLAPEIPSTLR